MKDFSTDQELNKAQSGAARVLVEHREEIIREWQTRVRQIVNTAEDLGVPILINTLPAFIDNLAEAISPDHPREDVTENNTVAQEHGEERARLTDYSPDQLIVEYQILREVIFVSLAPHVHLSEGERTTVNRSIDKSIRRAILAFTIVQSRLREHFVATLTHDLRNPLGAAKMALEFILATLKDVGDEVVREDLARLVNRAMNNTVRADKLIQNLLDATVLHAGKNVDLNIEACDLMSITHEVLSELNPRDRHRFRIAGETARGYWDPDGIRRVIENLVSNALKYGLPKHPVEIKIQVAHERAIFTIHNDGPAIPPNEVKGLFEVFKRTRSAQEGPRRGWGIGLALVHAVAVAHGGKATVDSSPESGTTFLVNVPVDARPFQKKARMH